MPRQCAFCPATANLSGEHLWSDWMRELFKSKGFTFRQRDEEGKVVKEWRSQKIDLKAKFVCKPCNGGWMGNLEKHHAKPALSDLIVGTKALTLSQSRAHSIALFAFKSAVVIDHMKGDAPFFRRSIRYGFRRTLTIPDNVQMWLAGFLPMGSGRFTTHYGEASHPKGGRLKLYACTYGVGHFIFQVTAWRSIGVRPFVPWPPRFANLAVPLWPSIPQGFSWPPPDVLQTRTDFDEFSKRWGQIRFVLG